jgi:hypothetical protein
MVARKQRICIDTPIVGGLFEQEFPEDAKTLSGL